MIRWPSISALTHTGEPLLTHCREVASILGALRLDAETLAAALTSGLPMVEEGWQQRLEQALGPQVATLVEGLARMGQIQALRSQGQESRKATDRSAQLEALRKMLLAMA